MTDATARCDAAHDDDPTPCEGPHDAVLIRDRQTTEGGVPGCVHHGARMLASIEGSRVYPGPSADTGHAPGSGGAAVDAFHRAQDTRPFPWMTNAPRNRPEQLSANENRERTPVFEVEQSGADSDGWDPDDPYGDVAEYENRAHH